MTNEKVHIRLGIGPKATSEEVAKAFESLDTRIEALEAEAVYKAMAELDLQRFGFTV